ncbi:hypothetical protein [Haloferax sp. DFSO60]|uniref:hypothetical protein n=1 Tax=Haloferax sp. DFSO60 TaxID=3388652 RepID=UPI00397C9B7B
MLFLAGGGLLLAVLGGGTAGQMGTAQAEHAGETSGGGREAAASHSGLKSSLNTDTSLRLAFLFYGSGVLLWSLIVLGTLGDTLV